ncbi:MAG: pyridoxamine 5'-phosphate oxidase family protein [Actinomycetota bacterium]|nr:pyridoxamine 5'-phosphate oxidase family protein [Actinomycetota bacterium]
MSDLTTTAPAFVDMAHRIVWATVATVNKAGDPTTRILHPIWEWDGADLKGWILTSPQSPKARHLDTNPVVSLTYWDATHDVATADCDTSWENSPEERRAGWDRFLHGPEPVGYDPSIIPFWPNPDVEGFGVLALRPRSLRVMPGSVMLQGQGEVLTWKG